MSEPVRVGDLEIEQDLTFQRREWVVQRVGWAVMLLVVLVGLTGLLGDGPLSGGAAAVGPLSVEYERIARRHADQNLTIRVGPDLPGEGAFALWIDREWLEAMDLRQIVPQPDSTAAGGDRSVFRFQRATDGEPAVIVFDVMPTGVGALEGRVGVEGGPEVAFGQFVLP